MVLGLGSKSKKDKGSSLLVDYEIRLLEIKPWNGLQQSSKSSASLILRWNRNEKLSGSTRSAVPKLGTASDGGKIVFNESFRLPATLYRESAKKAKKSSGDTAFQEKPLVFNLLEANNPKGQPLAYASLDLAAYAEIEDTKTISIPFTISKKVSSRGGNPYLQLTVGRYQNNRSPSSGGVSAGQVLNSQVPDVSSTCSPSSRASDEYSSPPLDEETQQSLVAALLSDNDDEIASFTDDESSHGSAASHDNVTAAVASGIRLPESNESSTNSPAQDRVDKQFEAADVRIPRPAISSPHASPVKSAAAAAVAAYAPKRSFLSRDASPFGASSNDFSSEPTSPGDDGFFTPSSHDARSPNLLPRSPLVASLSSSHTSVSTGGSDSVCSDAGVKGSEAIGNLQKEELKTRGEKEWLSEAESKSLEPSSSSNASVVKEVADVVREESEKREPESNLLEPSSMKLSQAGRTSNTNVGKKVTDAVGGKSTKDNEKPQPRESVEMKSPVVHKVGVQTNGSTTKAELDRSNLVVESNGRPTEARLNQKSFLARDSKTAKVVEKQTTINVKVDTGEVQVNSTVDEGKTMEDRYQRKSVDDIKSKLSVKTDRGAVVAMKEVGAFEEPKTKVSKSPDERNVKIEKKASEEAKVKVALAEAKVAAAEEKVQQLEMQVEMLKGELRDAAAVEAALYSITAEHGSSSLKVHTPARRLARLYIHACKHWSQERRASSARNTVAGLVLVARACGHDVPRLTFWWSNAAVLRETISMAFDVLPSSPSTSTETASSRSKLGGASRNSKETVSPAGVKIDTKPIGQQQRSQNFSPTGIPHDWREPSTFTAALERVEAWIYAKVVESVWWQALTPQMQQPADSSLQQSTAVDEFGEERGPQVRKNGKKLLGPELGDGRQGNISIDIWKKAFCDAYERLCPVRAVGVECGCLPMLTKLILEECVVRLDVAMFNAILRGSEDEGPTDPISDPISDTRVLPIPTGSLSFGAGAQLKNAVRTLSTWLTNLLSKDVVSSMADQTVEDDEKGLIIFPLLKATGDLLMLPKEMLTDKSVRKEVCPTLSLPFIGRILLSFIPDEFYPDPVSPLLLDAINAEISAESQTNGEMDCSAASQRIAFAPSIVYSPPQSSLVRYWIGDPTSHTRFGRSNSSLLRKGHTSDDEIDELESPISWLLENSAGLVSGGHSGPTPAHKDNGYANGKLKGISKGSLYETRTNCRFQLLREVWVTD